MEGRKYLGHELQLYGAEEVRLVGGQGDGLRLLQVRNATGLAFNVSIDRCADISRLALGGVNYGYFSPCGYVAPQYYDRRGLGFLRSFTAGFFTTCGLTGVGNGCVDDGEEGPVHGTISNIPCENFSHWVAEDGIHIKAIVRDAALGSHQLLLEREYVCPLYENEIRLTDKVRNIGSRVAPHEILYHCNIGYPLLSEKSVVNIPSEKVVPRSAHAEAGLARCLQMEIPQRGYEEMCYYHTFHGESTVSVSNPTVKRGVQISFNADELNFFTEWKMMGEREYVLGLEPGNCHPDGRDLMRKQGDLVFLAPEEEKTYHLTFRFTEE